MKRYDDSFSFLGTIPINGVAKENAEIKKRGLLVQYRPAPRRQLLQTTAILFEQYITAQKAMPLKAVSCASEVDLSLTMQRAVPCAKSRAEQLAFSV